MSRHLLLLSVAALLTIASVPSAHAADDSGLRCESEDLCAMLTDETATVSTTGEATGAAPSGMLTATELKGEADEIQSKFALETSGGKGIVAVKPRDLDPALSEALRASARIRFIEDLLSNAGRGVGDVVTITKTRKLKVF